MAKLILEICQNHKGDRELLGRLIREAAEAGADIVKMQSIFSEDLTKRDRFETGETDANGSQRVMKRPYAPEYERLSKLDLSLDDHRFFIDECKRNGVIPMTTIFSRHRVPQVASLPWPTRAVKVASYDCGSAPFLAELSDHFDHLVVSTGASFDEEIQKASEIVRSRGKKLSMLHCVTSYPNTLPACNLARIGWLRRYADEVGWSDHTLVERDGVKAAKLAFALGADYVERHFTVLPPSETKDGPVSITPALLAELRRFADLRDEEKWVEIKRDIPEWETMLGAPTREMTETERLNRDYYRGRFAERSGDGYRYNWEV